MVAWYSFVNKFDKPPGFWWRQTSTIFSDFHIPRSLENNGSCYRKRLKAQFVNFAFFGFGLSKLMSFFISSNITLCRTALKSYICVGVWWIYLVTYSRNTSCPKMSAILSQLLRVLHFTTLQICAVAASIPACSPREFDRVDVSDIVLAAASHLIFCQ